VKAGTLNVWPEPVRREDGLVVASATIEMPGGERQVLWYRVPESQAAALHPACDPFVVGTIYLLMQAGHDVYVHGQVSPSLLRNLVEFQAAWASWVAGLHQVEICADREEEAEVPADRTDTLVAFSGGVDSCFSAFRHARRVDLRFPRQLAAGVMVHGFDIPLDEPETFRSAVERSQKMLASLNLDLIPVATNYRTVVEDWTHSYGAGIASCLMLFAGRFGEGLIGQGLAYDHYLHLAEGSNPLTDALLSSCAFTVVPDGGGYQRADKIRLMAGWAEFLQYLRVCWAGDHKDRNCCECEKCIRNILTFRVLGLGLPPCFERDVSIEQIMRLTRLKEITMRTQYDNILRVAAERGCAEDWVTALRGRTEKNRRFQRSKIRREIARLPYYGSRILARVAALVRPIAKGARSVDAGGPR
jgi:hypothetical protein